MDPNIYVRNEVTFKFSRLASQYLADAYAKSYLKFTQLLSDLEVSPCLDNPTKQSHRGIRQRYYPTLGFGDFEGANSSVKLMMRCINFSGPISEWNLERNNKV